MTKCSQPGCTNEAIPCIMKWTDADGNIIITFCLEHEEKMHPK